MSRLALSCFIDSDGVSQRLHKTFHWLNGEGSYAHIRISSFSLAWIVGLQGEQVVGKYVCVSECVCLCVRGGPPVFFHDSCAWIKCGTLIWVKIMESYMSLSMSVFHSRPKWKVTAGRDRGGWQRCWNGNQATTRPSLWLTRSQAEPGLAVIKHQAAKKLLRLIFCLCLPVCLRVTVVKENSDAEGFVYDLTMTQVLE